MGYYIQKVELTSVITEGYSDQLPELGWQAITPGDAYTKIKFGRNAW